MTLTGAGGSGKTRLALQAAAELSDQFADGVFFVGSGAVAGDGRGPRDGGGGGWVAGRRRRCRLARVEAGACWCWTTSSISPLSTTVVGRTAGGRDDGVGDVAGAAASRCRAGAAGRAAARGGGGRAVRQSCGCCRTSGRGGRDGRSGVSAARQPAAGPRAGGRTGEAALAGGAAAAARRGAAAPDRRRRRPCRSGSGRCARRSSGATSCSTHDAQAAFRRLSVFRGSFTLDAAEAVAGADLDQVAALLDQSLLKPLGEERFFMLETIREYARERLDEAGETSEYSLRQARYYLARLEHDEPELRGPRRGELIEWSNAEEDNLRAMLDRLTRSRAEAAQRRRRCFSGVLAGARRLCRRDGSVRGVAWRPSDHLPDEQRARLLVCLADLESLVGDLDAVEAAASEALRLARSHSEAHAIALSTLGLVAARAADSDDAVRLRTASPRRVAASLDRAEAARASPRDRRHLLRDCGRKRGGAELLPRAARVLTRSGRESRDGRAH